MREMLLIFDNKIGLQTAIFYCIIGGLSAGISFSSFALLWDIGHFDYKLSVTIAYILAVLFNFICNRYFTFKSSGSRLVHHLYRYLIMILLNYLITMFIVHTAVQWLALSPYVGLFASIVATTITGFTLSKFWVYSCH